MIINVTKEGGGLTAQPTGQPKTELIPQSETRFLVRTIGAELTFHRDGPGKVMRFTLQQGSQSRAARRVEPFNAGSVALGDYAGDYYSDELGTVYSLLVKDGKLLAQHRRHGDITLTPTAVDQFSGSAWFFSRIRFTRDKDKRLTGFTLSGGRVRNLRFDRQAR